MERIARSHRSRSLPRRIRSAPYPLRLHHQYDVTGIGNPRSISPSLALEKKDWEDAKCSVCMESPHNAVLLLCSSHDKGCRPYMCATSHRHSNCLDQFNKAYTKTNDNDENLECIDLASCPLCRGQVKGWTVVEPAREFLNKKMRSCMQDNCSFTGTYKELKKHVRSEHPCAKPREVDPLMQQKWTRLENEREREDVISTIRSSMPRSMVFGDYVIEMANSDPEGSDEEVEVMGGDGSDGRGISRSILCFFLREGARLMRLDGDSDRTMSITVGGGDDDSGAAEAD
ncbi:uncharacterized protein LOC109821523, partial [Asparagus officinalis]|uniref:uncharacterized protein LOC109821523 n=1 Tax=Asparagus officinalis TaxID=4686 RepID=UPI00098E07CE